MNGKGLFVVRAVVTNPDDRPSFDKWYETEHLPDALKTFGALRAWRTWSRSDASVHIAFYEFPTRLKAPGAEAASSQGPHCCCWSKGSLSRVSLVRLRPGALVSRGTGSCGAP